RTIFPSAMPIAALSISPSGLPGASSNVAILQSTSSRSHMVDALGERACYGQKVSRWPNLFDLIVGTHASAPVGLVGAPLAAGSVTPGQCDLAPALLRQTLRRIGCYDVETGREIDTKTTDRGDADITGLSIEQATEPIRDAVRHSASLHGLTLLV